MTLAAAQPASCLPNPLAPRSATPERKPIQYPVPRMVANFTAPLRNIYRYPSCIFKAAQHLRNSAMCLMQALPSKAGFSLLKRVRGPCPTTFRRPAAEDLAAEDKEEVVEYEGDNRDGWDVEVHFDDSGVFSAFCKFPAAARPPLDSAESLDYPGSREIAKNFSRSARKPKQLGLP